jgi:hypothetical protein
MGGWFAGSLQAVDKKLWTIIGAGEAVGLPVPVLIPLSAVVSERRG